MLATILENLSRRGLCCNLDERAWHGLDLALFGASHAAGTNQQEEVQPAKRVGVLWDYYRQLVDDGWEPDVYSYTTSFR